MTSWEGTNVDENKFTRRLVENNLNRYFLKVENQEPVQVYHAVKVEDYERNTVFQMFKGDNEIRFTIRREVVEILPGEPTKVPDVIGYMEVNGEERVYLSQFSYLIEEPEYGPGKNITFSYETSFGGDGE